MFDCLSEVPPCFVDERPALLGEDAVMAWISLGQESFEPFCIGERLRRVSLLIEPIEQLVVEITDLVPQGGKLAPLGGWFTCHWSASVLLVSTPGAAFSLQGTMSPTFPIAFGDPPASPLASFSLSVEIASFLTARSCGCDRGLVCAASACACPLLLRPQRCTPRDNEARTRAAPNRLPATPSTFTAYQR